MTWASKEKKVSVIVGGRYDMLLTYFFFYMSMSEENIKRFNESVHSLYSVIMDKPLQVLNIFNDFFGEDKVDMQGACSEDELKSWLKTEPVSSYFSNNDLNIESSNWHTYSTLSIMDLPQDKFESALSLLSTNDIAMNIADIKFRGIFILVHFPHVRVTNEHDRYVDINHLWAKVIIRPDGTMYSGFTLNRSEYQVNHFMSDYLHSHVSGIPKHNFTMFQNPCTGSGPINTTMSSLNREFNSDLWQLFCLELSKYVTVESIAGRPYKYLERIGTDNMNIGVSSFTVFNTPRYWNDSIGSHKLKEFVKYFVQGNHLKFNYVNGSYSIGMSFIEFIVLISNEFIKWYNEQFNDKKMTATLEELKENYTVRECIICNGKIYYNNSRNNVNNLASYVGRKVCTFKGVEITLSITGISEVNGENKSIILDPQTALFILNQILKVLNYRYGRKTATHTEHQVGTEVRYL